MAGGEDAAGWLAGDLKSRRYLEARAGRLLSLRLTRFCAFSLQRGETRARLAQSSETNTHTLSSVWLSHRDADRSLAHSLPNPGLDDLSSARTSPLTQTTTTTTLTSSNTPHARPFVPASELLARDRARVALNRFKRLGRSNLSTPTNPLVCVPPGIPTPIRQK